MSIISVAIQKGGAGKTTTAINLAAALRQNGKSVLLIDADPQANLSSALGIPEDYELNLFTELKKEISGDNGGLEKVVFETKCGLSVVPSSIELASIEHELVSAYAREQILKSLLEPVADKYDFVIIDCPPALGMLTVNALTASDYVLMPLQAEFLPMKGVYSFIHHFNYIKNKLNKKLEILGFVLTRYDERKTLNREVYQKLENDFEGKVFNTRIRTNIQLAKSQEAGLDIFSFDKSSNGAIDYLKLASEFLDRLD